MTLCLYTLQLAKMTGNKNIQAHKNRAVLPVLFGLLSSNIVNAAVCDESFLVAVHLSNSLGLLGFV